MYAAIAKIGLFLTGCLWGALFSEGFSNFRLRKLKVGSETQQVKLSWLQQRVNQP